MSRSTLTLALASPLLFGSALAAPSADLAVSIAPPAGAYVYQNGTYRVTVANLSNSKNSSGVILTVALPRTGTSPQVYVHGTLGTFTGCTRSGTTLTCNLGTINRNSSKYVDINLALPFVSPSSNSSASLFAASVVASTADPNPANNSANHTASPLTYAASIPAPVTVVNRHCTGQNGLSSFFECELFPSSISSHSTTLESDGSVTFIPVAPGYTGDWTLTAPNQLQIRYYEDDGSGPQKVLEFNGRGVDAAPVGDSRCFEGKSNFWNAGVPSQYVSLYEVCKP